LLKRPMAGAAALDLRVRGVADRRGDVAAGGCAALAAAFAETGFRLAVIGEYQTKAEGVKVR
jgi:hypothetical protein